MKPIVGSERDALIVQILDRIESDSQVVGSPERVRAWERGWLEALSKFQVAPTEESLIPAFIHSHQPIRYNQEFCWPSDPDDELNYVKSLQKGFLFNHLKHCANVYEFGCGTGFNLAALAKLMPNANFCGFDFAQPAVELVREVGETLGFNLWAEHLDMTKPRQVELPEGSGIFTFGAIEQIPGRFEPFIEWLIERKPSIVCHVEPLPELLDPKNLVDSLSLRFMKKRNYTRGLMLHLLNHPKVQVVRAERSFYGSLMLESYGQIVWKPK